MKMNCPLEKEHYLPAFDMDGSRKGSIGAVCLGQAF